MICSLLGKPMEQKIRMFDLAIPRFNLLPLVAVQPAGWIREQMVRDLNDGFAGRLDQLTPHAASDLFTHRIASSADQMAWWDSETRGNWLWGYGMMAHLCQHPFHRQRVRELVHDLKQTQDDDGYIGIYSPPWRYQHPPGENGELWSQSRALLAMLAYYELTGDTSFLIAVQRAVRLTMQQYSSTHPYFQAPPGTARDTLGGLTHGLCYTDVLEWLNAIAPDQSYRAFGRQLYSEYCSLPRPLHNDDLTLVKLADSDIGFSGHAVHTAEHLRPLLWICQSSVDEIGRRAIQSALEKFKRYTLPSGALLGDESLHDTPVPEIGYEYCTLTEMVFSLTSALQKLGTCELGDWIENLVFNAAQGARLADGTALAYLSADDRSAAVASRGDYYSPTQPGRRFKYSPTHEDVACCCNPNATRLMSHYVSRMWMRLDARPGIAAVALGPCTVTTNIAGVRVKIDEDTHYPFADSITFTVTPTHPQRFALVIRRPAWADHATLVTADANISEAGGWWIVEKSWAIGDQVQVSFSPSVATVPYANDASGIRRGPLQYVMPIPSEVHPIKDYPLSGFHDYDFTPCDPVLASLPPDLRATDWQLVSSPDANLLRPWDRAPIQLIQGAMTLVPMGCTILRRAAFRIT